MKFKSLNIVLLPVIILFLQHSARSYAVVGKVGGCYSAIYSFGDSLADTGNLLAAAVAGGRNLSQLNFANLPYGETYFRNATGRYSDGRLIVDYIAQAFGLPFLEPYLRVRNTSKVAATGVNFAVAGATALKADFFKVRNIGPLLTPYSLDVQINWFLTQRRKICENYRDCDKHFANALFLMGEIGANDYNYPFFQRRPMKEVHTFIPLVVEKIAKALKTLITVGGARKILVQNNLPIGCSSSYLTLYASASSRNGEPLDKLGCLRRFNNFARKGNHLLGARVAQLQFQHPEVKFVFADLYGAALNVLKSPHSFGLQKNILRTCCGVGGRYNFNLSMWCGVGRAVVCANPQQYFNWDGVHLTDAAYGNIAKLFLDGSFTAPPLALTAMLN